MQKIAPMLWFDNQAEEAANFYVSVFKNSKVRQITHYTGEEFSEKKGQVMTVSFELITGRNSPLAAGRKWNADGSRTSTNSSGRLYRRSFSPNGRRTRPGCNG